MVFYIILPHIYCTIHKISLVLWEIQSDPCHTVRMVCATKPHVGPGWRRCRIWVLYMCRWFCSHTIINIKSVVVEQYRAFGARMLTIQSHTHTHFSRFVLLYIYDGHLFYISQNLCRDTASGIHNSPEPCSHISKMIEQKIKKQREGRRVRDKLLAPAATATERRHEARLPGVRLPWLDTQVCVRTKKKQMPCRALNTKHIKNGKCI